MHNTKLFARMRTATQQLRPTHLYETLVEGARLLKEARSIRDDDTKTDSDAIRRRLFVKFTAALAVSEVASSYICSPIAGMSVQYASGNPYHGIWATVLGYYTSALVSFHITWAALNAGYYAKNHSSFLTKARTFASDAFSFIKIHASASLPVYAIGATLSAIAITAVDFVSTTLAYKFPLPILTISIELFVCEAIFLSLLMRPSIELISRIGASYATYLETRNGSPKIDTTVSDAANVN